MGCFTYTYGMRQIFSWYSHTFIIAIVCIESIFAYYFYFFTSEFIWYVIISESQSSSGSGTMRRSLSRTSIKGLLSPSKPTHFIIAFFSFVHFPFHSRFITSGGLDTTGRFSAIFTRGDNFYNCFSATNPLLKRGLLWKGRICFQGKQILPF